MKPYPVMKDTGVAWLPEVPEHWPLAPLRRGFRAITRRDIHGDEVKMSMSRHLGLVPSTALGSRNTEPSASMTYSVCHPGDLVMNKYQAQAGIFGCATVRGLITPNYTVFAPSASASSAYFARLFASTPYQTAFEMASYGVGDGMAPLYTNVFYRVPAPFPPLVEQAAIVSFLDHADRRIRRYIAAKQNLIALLNEQRQAMILEAVTHGVEPSVRLKPSGVDWLGDVPEDWQVVRNKAVMSPRKRTVGSRSTDFTLLSLTLRGVIPRDLENPEGKFPADFGTYQVVNPGELVFCLFDMDETPRTVGIAPVRGMVTGAYSVFECIDGEMARFLYHFYLAMDAQKRLRPFYTGLRKVVQNDTFMSIKVAIPPRQEMHAILSTIATEVARIDDAVVRTERELHLIQEFRSQLITDVVTGKLDVREAAVQMEEGTEYPDLLPDRDVRTDGDESDDLADFRGALDRVET